MTGSYEHWLEYLEASPVAEHAFIGLDERGALHVVFLRDPMPSEGESG